MTIITLASQTDGVGARDNADPQLLERLRGSRWQPMTWTRGDLLYSLDVSRSKRVAPQTYRLWARIDFVSSREEGGVIYDSEVMQLDLRCGAENFKFRYLAIELYKDFHSVHSWRSVRPDREQWQEVVPDSNLEAFREAACDQLVRRLQKPSR